MKREMKPIDVLEKKRKMDEACNVKTFLKKPGCVFNSVTMVTFQAASIVTTNVPFDLFCLLVSGYNLFRLFGKWEQYKDVYGRLALELEKTPVYSRMSENYFTFVHEVAKFLKQFEIKDTKELLCLLELMMKDGMFSYNSKHEYHKYKYDTGEMSGTTGAHVTTGKCVCRHMAAFFSDILYYLRIEGCNISARVRYEDEVKDFLKLFKKRTFNHAVVGIVDGDKRFMFDPTNDIFIGASKRKFRFFRKDQVGKTIIRDKDAYVFTSAKSVWMNKLHLDEYKNYNNKVAFEEIDFDRIAELRKKVEEFYKNNKPAFEEFYKKTSHFLEDVRRDLSMLSPKSDEEIKEWVLKY